MKRRLRGSIINCQWKNLMEIIRRYDGMSLKDRLLLPEKDIINYQAAERTINRKEEK